jgi:hypothetical protein
MKSQITLLGYRVSVRLSLAFALLLCAASVMIYVNHANAAGGSKEATFNAERASGGEALRIAAAPTPVSVIGPTLGNYPNSTVALSGEVTVTPDAAPTNATSINVSTSSDFKGTFSADPATGVVRVTDAATAGTYPVTVRASDSGGASTTRTFTLTVQAGTACASALAFTNAADVPVGSSPYSVAVGDFNNDGIQDLAVASINLNTVSIRLGKGSGSFSGSSNTSVGSHPQSVAVGDFNGDGKQDIAAANSDSSSVSILLGDGAGGISGGTNVSVGTTPISVAVGDFNGDGIQDIAAANSGSNTVSIRLGGGLGGFSGTTNVGVGSHPQSVTLGDFNNDGKQDIAVANASSSNVSILLGDGAGGVSGATNVGVGNTPMSVAVGDFNGDGKQDLAVANILSNTVSIRLGDGLGGFSGATNVGVGAAPYSVAVADFNNDGIQDFAVSNEGTTTVSIRLGDGAGGFSGATNVGVGATPYSVAVGDFNNDGIQDLAVTNKFSSIVTIRLAAACSAPLTLGNYPNSTVALSAEVTVTPDAAPTNATSINVSTSTNFQGTFSADPTTGVVRVTDAAPAGTYTVTVTAFNGTVRTTRTFTLTVQAGTACAGASVFTDADDASVDSFPQSVAVGDFNNDGKQDIAVTNSNSSSVSIRLGDGLGGFSGTTDVSVGTQPMAVAVGDFNNDGKQDIAAANQVSNTVSIRLGDGAGNFSGTTDVSVGTQPISVSVGDFNNDGKQDLAVAILFSSTVSIRLGDGLGNFSGSTNVSVASTPVSVAIGDFNGDGKQDLAVANYGSNTISIRLGDGLGGFTSATDVNVGSNPRSVAIGDFNNDGKQDFAVANLYSNTVSIRLGDGAGGFIGSTEISVGSNPESVAVGDFNNDGKQDLAVANANSNTASIRSGDGAGGFSGSAEINVGSTPESVAVGDFNNDSRQDLAVANFNSNTVSILLGGCNLSPTIAAATGLSRQQGSAATNSQIASVTDDGGNGNVSVNVISANPSNGVTISNINNTGGNITADIVADCTATNATFTLQTSDGTSTANDTLNITVTANTAPTLTYSNPPALAFNGSTTINPATGPADNGSVSTIVVQSQGTYTGTISVNNATGVVSISNAAPAGTHTIVIRATDNCGTTTDASFTLTVQPQPPTLGNYPNTMVTLGADTTITPDAAPTNATNINVATLTDFTGTFTANSTTGVVRVTDAGPAGTYTLMVTAFNGTVSTTRTFTLTVQTGTACAGTPVFTNAADSSVGSLPFSVAVGDFDGDGKQDIAVANAGSSTVSIRLGDGLGNFSGTTEVSVGSSPFSVAVGDFDGDGKQDLAVANQFSNTVSIRLGDGAGGFSGTIEVSVGANPRSVALGDFNNDGKEDLAVVNNGSSTVSIRLGDGLGNFSGTTEVSVGSLPQKVAVGDFDGDGKQDIAVAAADSNTVSIRLGDGAGGFGGTTEVSGGTNPYSVAVGDFNNDGKQDIAVADAGSATVSIRLGDGAGNFSGSTEVSVGANPFSVAVGDFNNDGKQDIAVANESANTVSIRLGDGLGNFSGSTELSVGSGPVSVAVGDFNNDGKQDLAVANLNSDTVSIRLGGCNSAPTITPVTGVSRQQGSPVSNSQIAGVTDDGGNGNVGVTITSANPSNGVTISNIVNTNGTITADISAACGASNASFTLQAGDGISTTTDTLNITVPANTAPVLTYGNQTVAFNGSLNVTPTSAADKGSITGYSVQSVSPALTTTPTVNASGVVSITGAQPAGAHTITIRATDNCGVTTDGTFTLDVQPQPPTLGNYPNTMVALGADATITPDAAPTITTSINVSTLTNFKGTFSADPATGVVRVTDAHPAGIYTVTIRAFASGGASTTKTFTLTVQSGTACAAVSVFTNKPDSIVGTGPRSVAVGDFNNDGRQDIAVANSASNTVSIRLGAGAGNFSEVTDVGVGSTPRSVAVGDFNGDGKQDLAVANFDSNTVSIRLGNGAGGFSGSTEVSVGDHPLSVAVGDFNNDGIQDLAVANNSSNTVSIRLGDGAGNFSGATDLSIGSGSTSVAVGDFNNDGIQDLAIANANLNKVLIRLGDGAGNFSGSTEVDVVSAGSPSMAIGDFNNDGKQDLAVANFSQDSVSIRLGDGAGGFSGSTDVSVGAAPVSVAVGDFNNDGLQDIAAAGFSSNTVSIRLGDGAGGFSSATEPSVDFFSSAVAVGDFNGDGKQDLVVANFQFGTVSIRLGDCDLPPAITAATGLSRQQGSPAADFQIASVTDDDGNGNVTVKINNSTSATVNGVTVSNIRNIAGAILADIVADCSASNASFTLQASDGILTATDTLNITVTVNTAPALNYANPSALAFNGSTTVTPAASADNGSITGYSVQNVVPALTSAPAVNSSGAVSITNAQPAGKHTITIRATDNCGLATDASFDLTVSKADQTITVNTHAPANAAYNSNFTVAATSNSSLPVTYSSAGACTNSGATFTMTSGAGTCTVKYDQSGDGNYNAATQVTESVTAQKANQTIAVNTHAPASAAYNTSFTITAASNSGLAIAYSSSGVCSNAGATFTMTSGTGTCTVKYDQAGDNNYNAASQVIESVTAQKVSQSITLGTHAPANATYNASFTVAAASSSGGAISYSAAGVCTNVGPVFTMTSGTGTCTVKYDQAGDSNYNAATQVTESVSAQKANQTISIGTHAPANSTYNTSFTVAATSNSGLALSYSSSGACTNVGSVFTMTSGSGICTVKYDQAGDSNYNAASQVIESVTAQHANQSINVGTHAPASASYNSSFTVAAASNSGFAIAYSSSGVCTNAGPVFTIISGTGTCTVKYDQAGDGNYNAATQVTESVTAQTAATTTVVSSSPNPSALAQKVTFTASVSSAGGAPTGTVTFKDHGSAIKCSNAGGQTLDASGLARCQASSLTAGLHTITADYSGDANFQAGTGTLSGGQLVSNQALLSFSQAEYSVNESTGFITITVNRTGDLSGKVTVDYATDDTGAPTQCEPVSGNTLASSRCDFGMTLGTLRFAASETQKSFVIPITQDAFTEEPETFTVSLSNVTGIAALTLPTSATVTISDATSPMGNAIDDTEIFVRQQYRDFLNREADPAGLAFWKDNIEKCKDPARLAPGQTVLQCLEDQRLNTSAAFFLSIEFQQTGNFVRSFYVAALDRPLTNNMPGLIEFERDTQAVQNDVTVGQSNWQQTLNDNRNAFMRDFVTRAEFAGLYPTADSPTQYVDKLYQHAGIIPAASERSNAIAEFGGAATAADAAARGRALLDVTQNATFQQREMNRSFVQMEYFGYLRRNPNDAPDKNFAGYDFWLNKLNAASGNYIISEMVKAFITSSEYRGRFGP